MTNPQMEKGLSVDKDLVFQDIELQAENSLAESALNPGDDI